MRTVLELTHLKSLLRTIACLDIFHILCRDKRPHEIYNLAAQSHVGLSLKEPVLTAASGSLVQLHSLRASFGPLANQHLST